MVRYGSSIKTDSNGDYFVNVGYWGRAGDYWLIEFWDCRSHPVYAPAYKNVRAPDGGTVGGVDATLMVGARIVGRVLDSIGQPASGISVWVYDGSHSDFPGVFLPEYTVHADPEGRFELSGLSSANQMIAFDLCTHDGRVPSSSDWGDQCAGSPYLAEVYRDHPWTDCGGPDPSSCADKVTVSLGGTTDLGTITVALAPSPSPSASL